jgi:hypothetical protein
MTLLPGVTALSQLLGIPARWGGGGATRTLVPKTDENIVEWKDAWGVTELG